MSHSSQLMSATLTQKDLDDKPLHELKKQWEQLSPTQPLTCSP